MHFLLRFSFYRIIDFFKQINLIYNITKHIKRKLFPLLLIYIQLYLENQILVKHSSFLTILNPMK